MHPIVSVRHYGGIPAESIEAGAFRHATSRWRLAALVLVFVLLGAVSVARAVMIAPHALFIDHRTRSTVFYIHNPDDHPVDVTVELIYGYPRDDGQGGVRVFLDEDPDPSEPSCASWVRVLPRRMTIQPGKRQAVRLLASPPTGLPDGEYWSRVAITAVKSSTPRSVEGAEGVQVGLNLATRTIISLNYRKGPMHASVELGAMKAELGSKELALTLDLTRTGTAAWLGRAQVVLEDVTGEQLQQWDRDLAVYTSVHRILHLPLDTSLVPGHYIVSLRLDTDREDLPPEGVLPSGVILRSLALVYGGTDSGSGKGTGIGQ